MPEQFFVIGGGGFTHQAEGFAEDQLLEDRLIALAGPVASVRIGYIGHANGDSPCRLAAFHDRFADCAVAEVLPLAADAATAQRFLSGLDILYVAGGTTTKMLAHWHRCGISPLLAEAARRGVIMAGVSAGAICWFQALLLGTAEAGYALWPGLGLLPGSACPHYNTEPKRKAAYDNLVHEKKLAAGVAIDDGVAVHIADGEVLDIIRPRHDEGNAFRVWSDNGVLRKAVLRVGESLKATASIESVRPPLVAGESLKATTSMEMSKPASHRVGFSEGSKPDAK